MQSHTRSLLQMTAAAALWSIGGVLIKGISWPALTLAGMRSLVALVFFLIWRGGWKVRYSPTMLLGALAYALTLISFVSATKLTTAANAILLQYTAPIYVALFGIWFLKEKIHRHDLLTMVLVIAGMALFFLDKLSTSGTLGNLIAIFSGVSFAWLVLLLRKQKDASPIDTVILGNLLVVLICLPFYGGLDSRPGNWIGIVVMGVLQIAVPYILFTQAIRHVRAIEAILVPTLEPILNPVWVFLFLGERPGHWALIGGVIVIASLLLHQLIAAKQARAS